MDLDELKQIWDSNPPQSVMDKAWVVPGQVGRRWKSKHPVDRIRRKLLLENLVGLILLIPFLLLFGSKNLHTPAYVFYIFLGIVVASLVYAGIVIIRYERAYSLSDSMQAYLARCLGIIKGYIKLITISLYIFMPVSTLIGYTVGLQYGSDDGFDGILFHPLSITAAVLLTLASALLYPWLVKLYYRKLYGKHIAELEESLKQLSENDKEDLI